MQERKMIRISDKENIKAILKNENIPDWLRGTFFVNRYGDIYEDTAIGVLLTNLYFQFEIENFYLAEGLLKKGFSLPLPSSTRKNHKTLFDFFDHLVRSPRDLFIVLHKHPEIIRNTDEYHQTLLHHAAKFTSKVDENPAHLILHLLFNAPGLDFTIKDKYRNTALDIAAVGNNKSIYAAFIAAAKHSDEKKINYKC